MKSNIEDLDPRLRQVAVDFLSEIQTQKYKYLIIETLRTREKQEALYAQGRKPLEEVNRLRNIAGLPDITEKQNEKCVTNTLKSRHLPNAEGFAEAFDIVAFDRTTGDIIWNERVREGIMPYRDAFLISKKYPILDAGYGWKHFKGDLGHYELKNEGGSK